MNFFIETPQEPLAKFMQFSRCLFALSPILNDLKFAQSLT